MWRVTMNWLMLESGTYGIDSFRQCCETINTRRRIYPFCVLTLESSRWRERHLCSGAHELLDFLNPPQGVLPSWCNGHCVQRPVRPENSPRRVSREEANSRSFHRFGRLRSGRILAKYLADAHVLPFAAVCRPDRHQRFRLPRKSCHPLLNRRSISCAMSNPSCTRSATSVTGRACR